MVSLMLNHVRWGVEIEGKVVMSDKQKMSMANPTVCSKTTELMKMTEE